MAGAHRSGGGSWPPELALAIPGFSLNLAWEFWQIPFYEGMREEPHGAGTLFCSFAAAGDLAIMLVAFWAAAAVAGSRHWLLSPGRRGWAVYLGTGIALIVASEYVLSHRMTMWSYSDLMPVIPGVRIAIVPVLQWLIVPPCALVLGRRLLDPPGSRS